MRAFARRLGWLALAWALLVALPEWPRAREWLAGPLDVGEPDARGDVAYVMASGRLSLEERLSAAADLVHEHRVERILLARDSTLSRYDFRAKRSRTADEWSVAYLEWLGVPAERIAFLPAGAADGRAWLDTLAEAQAVRAWAAADAAAAAGPGAGAGAADPGAPGVHRIVVVSSPVHLRRARLAFRRVMGADYEVQAFAASALPDGPDFLRPLWLEYLKLGIYWLLA